MAPCCFPAPLHSFSPVLNSEHEEGEGMDGIWASKRGQNGQFMFLPYRTILESERTV